MSIMAAVSTGRRDLRHNVSTKEFVEPSDECVFHQRSARGLPTMCSVKAGPYLPVLAGAVLAATMAGCSQSNSFSTTQAVPASSSPAAASAPASSSLYCTVPLPESWVSALKTEVGPAQPNLQNVFAVSPNGSEYFATKYSSAWSGVVGVFPATGIVVEISRFPDPALFQDQVLSAAFDGGWLVWTESYTLQAPWPASLMAWNSQTNEVVTLFHSSSASHGVVVGALANGVLAWVEGIGKQTTVQLFNLNTRTDRIIFRGAAGIPVFWGGEILFSVGPPSTNHLVAYSSRTGKAIELPRGLRQVRGVAGETLAATPDEVVWTHGAGTSTWLWRRGDKRAQEVGTDSLYAISTGPPPKVLANSDFLWWNGRASMIVDPQRGSMASFRATSGATTFEGSAATDRDMILGAYRPPGASKIKLLPTLTSLVTVAKLSPLPGCSK
jgi:hypothetical protein